MDRRFDTISVLAGCKAHDVIHVPPDGDSCALPIGGDVSEYAALQGPADAVEDLGGVVSAKNKSDLYHNGVAIRGSGVQAGARRVILNLVKCFADVVFENNYFRDGHAGGARETNDVGEEIRNGRAGRFAPPDVRGFFGPGGVQRMTRLVGGIVVAESS